MPATNDPDFFVKYQDAYTDAWPKAMYQLYTIYVPMIAATQSKEAAITAINKLPEIPNPRDFGENDDTMGRDHAFSDAQKALRKYLLECIEEGKVPTYASVIINNRPKPKIALLSF